jgi:hypothetical protein
MEKLITCKTCDLQDHIESEIPRIPHLKKHSSPTSQALNYTGCIACFQIRRNNPHFPIPPKKQHKLINITTATTLTHKFIN